MGLIKKGTLYSYNQNDDNPHIGEAVDAAGLEYDWEDSGDTWESVWASSRIFNLEKLSTRRLFNWELVGE